MLFQINCIDNVVTNGLKQRKKKTCKYSSSNMCFCLKYVKIGCFDRLF